MRTYLFLLVYVLGSCFGASSAERNATCTTREACGQVPDPTSHFLQCVGLPSNDTGRDHMRRLKEMLGATMDVYTFMRSSMEGVPFLSLQGELAFNPRADPLQNEALVQMWMEVKIKPLLKSITKHFLACLSTKNFSCSTYRTVVRELSHHYSEMNPVRQKWIYTFFMYPFLSGDRVAGCVSRHESSEEWLMKNFGAFRAMARLKDFSTLNMVFSGLEVLHLLSPVQKAELLLRPEVASLDNGALSLVFHSLMTEGPGPPPTGSPGGGHPWTTPGGGYNWTTPSGGHNYTTHGGGHNYTTHGGGHNWTTHGGGHNYTTHGGGHNLTTLSGGHNYTTHGGGHNLTTLSGGHNYTTHGGGHNWTTPSGGHNWTSHGYPTYSPYPTYSITYQPPSQQENLRTVVNGFMSVFKPVGRLVHDFVSFTKERDVSEIRSTTLAQFLINWGLAELADAIQPKNISTVPEGPKFDVTNVEDWYEHVVTPVLRRFLPNEALMHPNITLAFYQVFHLDHGIMGNETSEIQDVCSITLDNSPCGLTDAVANVANILHCAARSNLTMSEETVMRLIAELTERLNLLIKELSTANFKELASDFQQIFGEADPPSLTQEHLEDPNYIELWFQIKLVPLLPNVPTDLLSCLSTKNFSCPVFQTIVAAFSKYERYSYPNYNIYKSFIYPFLMHHNDSDPQCVSSANNSAEWLIKNFGVYSKVPSITDFYKLNPNFSGLEVLHLLSPRQIAQLLLLPLPTPPEKDVVIDRVFDFLLENPEDGKLLEVLSYLRYYIYGANVSCEVYQQIFERLYGAIPLLPQNVEAVIWGYIDQLRNLVPDECVPKNFACPVIQSNGTNICRGVNSSDLHSHLNTSMVVPCNIPLETYACAQLENFTANQLVSLLKCSLPSFNRQSKVLWKLLLTKLSPILDPALDMLANTSMVGPSASAVLDVIGEIRVSMLTDVQLMNSSVIRKWFSGRLSAFLPFASVRFLHCLSSRNLSCHSYQLILQEFIHHFDNISTRQQVVVAEDFIVPFLSRPHSGPGCVSVSNGSAEWLMENLGPFSQFLSVKEMLQLNPQFKPLEVLQLLTPLQSAELLLLILPSSLEKDAIINTIFDHLTESPDERDLQLFLVYLIIILPQGNLSCSSYRTLFTRLDLATPTASLNTVSYITNTKTQLSKYIPPGCIIYSGQCNVVMANESNICAGVNSTMLQLHLDSGLMNGRFCDFAVEEFACASLAALKAEDLAAILACNRSSNSSGSRPVWKLLLSKASLVLDAALDLLTNTTLDPRNPAVSMVLDSIREIRLDTFGVASLNNPAFIQLWFNRRLRPFLPAISPDFLSCLTTKGLNCSTYQQIVQILSRLQPHMTLARQVSVYTHFIRVFLTRNNTADSSCSSNTINSGEWLQRNLGGFSVLVSFNDLQLLYSNFSAMEALPQLTVRQLAEVSSTPGQLTSADQVFMVMRRIPDRFFPAFFDYFSPAIMGHENMFQSAVRSAMLQVVFERANLSDHLVGDSVVSQWFHNRLRPLLVNLSLRHVAPFFRILAGRNCSIEQQGVENLNSTISSLSEDTKKEIHNHIVQLLKGPIPLQCYGDNFNHSFYSFLERSFGGFQFPNLTTFLSLMPHDRMHQLVNSMPPSALGDFLRRPDVVDNDAELCVIYDNFIQTPMFLETEYLPAVVRRPTLPCVWRMAISSSESSEVNAWFDRRLHNYLGFLTKSLISPNRTHNASCLAFQKIVSVLGEYNYTAVDFMRPDVFNTIRAYLTSATVPRCYNPSNPELNSTAWFAEYIGPFMPFLTLEDLLMFGSDKVIQEFTVNPVNIAILNHTTLPLNFIEYYTELVYKQDINFYPLLLPLLYRCFASGPAFSQLASQESIMVLHNLSIICTALDSQITAALAGNLGGDIDATAISSLGNGSTGLSTGQIKTIDPLDLYDALTTLSDVTGWDEGQAKAIIQALLSSGMVQINSMSSLLMLGSLVVGVPAETFSSISGSELITASKNPSFLEHIASAPQVVRELFVAQIISVNSDSDKIILNVPDELASEIPRALLLGLSNTGSTIDTLNNKKWERDQVELFFDVMAAESATAELGSPNNLSSSVLQGFTCTGVGSVQKAQINKLIKACRRTGSNKVTLEETQLTCMYNHIKEETDATSFDLYPHDMLLYYDYPMVPQSSCRSYFEQLSKADFSVFSSALSYKQTALFDNARSCLDITNTSLTKDDISVLGNMCCVLDGSYIETSDPSILEELKDCTDLDSAQAAAVEALLQSGATQYGAPSTWNGDTLKDLGMIPLYLTSTFYNYFDKETKRDFLSYFLKVTESNGVSRQNEKTLKEELRKSLQKRSKRSIATECTVGTITQVTISAATFPFDYDDINQFNCCLSASTVKDNLEAITDKVDQEEYLKIVLSKLREAYAADSTIPEDQVQLLGPASRVATIVDINMWNITQIDTLSALMNSMNGPWDSSLAKAIITKYLSNAGNKLGSYELNAIGGANLCFLDVSVLESITPASLKDANALTVTSCSTEKKKALFIIAREAFATNTRSTVPTSTYQLTIPYIGGANVTYVRSLATSNINMDLATFTSLDENVLLNLTVSEVQGLLGTNLPDLKPYENQTVVSNWISRQSRSALNALGLGLLGGRADSTASTNSTTNTTAAPTSSNSAAASTAAPTSSNSAAASTAAPTSSNTAAASTAAPTTSNSTATATAAPTSSNSMAASTAAPTSSNSTAASTAAPTSSNSTAASTAAPTSSNPTTTTITTTTTTSSPTTTSSVSTSTSSPTTTSSVTTTTSSPTTTSSVTTTTSSVTTTTGNNGAHIRADAGFSFLILLTLLTASLV
ncbi:uncharacterized protein LOC141764496 isoform X2 [Sebastes fasciatus]|uniref:uncharacterized protein LOC141764496 isoform X2 n=1 Tax=Sebastes fasciatus TaxID=394691 RepID=UPI003D9F2E8C